MTNIQPIDSIAPISEAKTEKNDPVKTEYEEGKAFLANGSYGQAAIALHNVLLSYEERSDDNGIANASNQLGHVCLAKGEFDKALTYYSRALDIVDKANDRMSIIAVQYKIVEAQKGLKNYDAAIKVCLEIIDHHHDNRDVHGSVRVLEEMAEIYQQKGDNVKAADTFRTIASIHKNYRHPKIAEGFVKRAEELENK